MSNDHTHFHDIAKQAKLLAQQNEQVDWECVAFNLFLVPATLGTFCLNTTDHSKAKKEVMPDEWLQAVANLPNVSKKGLDYLAKALSHKGFVSVQDAVDFVEIERKERLRTTEVQSNKSTGAAMLLARAEKELPGTIERFTEGSKEFLKAASGTAAFAAEKAIWVGKGLGAVAQVLKDTRKR